MFQIELRAVPVRQHSDHWTREARVLFRGEPLTAWVEAIEMLPACHEMARRAGTDAATPRVLAGIVYNALLRAQERATGAAKMQYAERCQQRGAPINRYHKDVILPRQVKCREWWVEGRGVGWRPEMTVTLGPERR